MCFGPKSFMVVNDPVIAKHILRDNPDNYDKGALSLVLEDIMGDDNPPSVTGAKFRNVKTDEITETTLDGVFVAIGHNPATEIFKGHLKLDDEGYVLTKPDSTATDIPGVFAAGDVKDKVFRQAVTAAGMGCMAALEAEKFVAEHEVHSEAAE